MNKIKSLSLLLIFLGTSVFAFSQKIKESTESIGDLTGNALNVEIIKADQKEIEREWKSIMKNYDGKVKTRGNNIYTSDARIESISSGDVQINAEIEEEKNNNHRFTVIFMSEKGAVSSKDDVSGYTAAKMIVQKFAKDLSIEAASEHKESEEKKLMRLQKEKESLQRENEKLTEKIEDYENRITEAQETIESNKKTLIRNQEELKKQEEAVLKSTKELKSIK